MNFNRPTGLWRPAANISAHSADPLGNATAMTDAMLMISTIPLGSIPPARAMLAAIGVRIAAVPVLDINVVITMATTANTTITTRPLGESPRIFKIPLPISSPTPELPMASDTTNTPAIIHTMSPVILVMASFAVRDPV